MLFNSLVFCVFFVATYSAYVALLRHHRLQNLLLLGASYLFYGWWDWRFLGLLAFSTAVDFSIGLAMGRLDSKQAGAHRKRRMLLTASIVTNLGLLGIFKYFDFFAESAIDMLNLVGFEPDYITLNVILPVGISFYTFQTLSYTIDVFRQKIQPTRNPVDFALFVAFFPQLVAGPIERAANLLPQIALPRVITPERIWSGGYLIVWGYFEKVYLADNVGRIADQVFNNHEKYAGVDVLIGVVAFALQIYGDFSGYSNIARGLARIMGFDLMVNFRLPYFATSPADFWHRWHISLSTWLRDYLYIPLGGNRRGSLITYRNLMITMLLGGLWHGAAWNFVCWGAYHGVGLAANRLYRNLRPAKRGIGARSDALSTYWKLPCMFIFTLGGWLLFRAADMEQVFDMLGALGWSTSAATAAMVGSVVLYATPFIVVQMIQHRSGDMMILARLPAPAAGFVLAVILVMIAVLGAREPMEFIYFQF